MVKQQEASMKTSLQAFGIICCVLALIAMSAKMLFVNHYEGQDFNSHNDFRQRHLHVMNTHKDLFPLSSSDYVGSILVFLGLIIAASGGIGGGGILVPLLILVFGFHPKFAIALSNFTIFGSALTNTTLNFPKRHPLADRPLVDWDLILVMEPLTAAGAIIGAYMSKVLPDWFLGRSFSN